MNALAFDTLAFARRLEAAGFSRVQAEALAEEQARLIDERLATKADIAAIRADIEALRLSTARDIEALRLSGKADIEALRLSGKADIEALRLSGKHDLAEVRADILKWLVGSVGLQTVVILGSLLALLRLLPH